MNVDRWPRVKELFYAALGEYERFLGYWKNADGDLPELAEARRAVSWLRTQS